LFPGVRIGYESRRRAEVEFDRTQQNANSLLWRTTCRPILGGWVCRYIRADHCVRLFGSGSVPSCTNGRVEQQTEGLDGDARMNSPRVKTRGIKISGSGLSQVLFRTEPSATPARRCVLAPIQRNLQRLPPSMRESGDHALGAISTPRVQLRGKFGWCLHVSHYSLGGNPSFVTGEDVTMRRPNEGQYGEYQSAGVMASLAPNPRCAL
jgi:hypothetical protein